MDFVDNVIDRSSGTIRGRAVFANPDGTFTPGMFGRVRVPGSPPYEALLVPDAAIGTEQVRKFVLVVDAENVARTKYVTLGQLVGDLRVIKDGLGAGRPRHRQRPDARAAGRQGDAAGAGRAAPRRRRRRRRAEAASRCASRTSSSTGRSSPRCSRSCSSSSAACRSSACRSRSIPRSRRRSSTSAGQYPGASAEVVAATVVAPIEQQINGVENMLYMSSNATADGRFSIAVTFDLGTNLDIAQVQVQNRVGDRAAAPAGRRAQHRRHGRPRPRPT